MPDATSRMSYITYERGWMPRPCPDCGATVTSHGFLFWDPPPPPPQPDGRRAWGHVYIHEGTNKDCVVAGKKYL